jgi:hypothetical protein
MEPCQCIKCKRIEVNTDRPFCLSCYKNEILPIIDKHRSYKDSTEYNNALKIYKEEVKFNGHHTKYHKEIFLLLKAIYNNSKIEIKNEYKDGLKNVDIAILQHGKPFLYIEIDGKQHYTEYTSLWSDSWRNHNSFINGIPTIHISNRQLETSSGLYISSSKPYLITYLIQQTVKALQENHKCSLQYLIKSNKRLKIISAILFVLLCGTTYYFIKNVFA